MLLLSLTFLLIKIVRIKGAVGSLTIMLATVMVSILVQHSLHLLHVMLLFFADVYCMVFINSLFAICILEFAGLFFICIFSFTIFVFFVATGRIGAGFASAIFCFGLYGR